MFAAYSVRLSKVNGISRKRRLSLLRLFNSRAGLKRRGHMMKYENNKLEKLAQYLSVDVEELKALLGLPNGTGLNKAKTIKQLIAFYGNIQGKCLLRQITLAKLANAIKNRLRKVKTFEEISYLENCIAISKNDEDDIEFKDLRLLFVDKQLEIAATEWELNVAHQALKDMNEYESFFLHAIGINPEDISERLNNKATFKEAKKVAYSIYNCDGSLAIRAFKKVMCEGKALLLNADIDMSREIFFGTPRVTSIKLKQVAVNRMLELI